MIWMRFSTLVLLLCCMYSKTTNFTIQNKTGLSNPVNQSESERKEGAESRFQQRGKRKDASHVCVPSLFTVCCYRSTGHQLKGNQKFMLNLCTRSYCNNETSFCYKYSLFTPIFLIIAYVSHLTAHQPAKRARLTRSSIRSIRLTLGLIWRLSTLCYTITQCKSMVISCISVSNCTNLNRVSNNKHCKYHCVVLSSFG